MKSFQNRTLHHYAITSRFHDLKDPRAEDVGAILGEIESHV
jgi:hypothetical protein